MAKTDRDRLIKTFMSRNRRKGKGPLDQGLPSNPGGAPMFKPGKASAATDTNLYRLRVGPPGGRVSQRIPMGEGGPELYGTPEGAGRISGGFKAPYTGPVSPRVRKMLRKRGTKPTPGSAYNRHKPTPN